MKETPTNEDHVKHLVDELNQFQHTHPGDDSRLPTMEEQVVTSQQKQATSEDTEEEAITWIPQLGMLVTAEGYDGVFVIDDYLGHTDTFILRSTNPGYERVPVDASKVSPYQLYAKRPLR